MCRPSPLLVYVSLFDPSFHDKSRPSSKRFLDFTFGSVVMFFSGFTFKVSGISSTRVSVYSEFVVGYNVIIIILCNILKLTLL